MSMRTYGEEIYGVCVDGLDTARFLEATKDMEFAKECERNGWSYLGMDRHSLKQECEQFYGNYDLVVVLQDYVLQKSGMELDYVVGDEETVLGLSPTYPWQRQKNYTDLQIREVLYKYVEPLLCKDELIEYKNVTYEG